MAQEFFKNLPQNVGQAPTKVEDQKVKNLLGEITIDTTSKVTRADILKIKKEVEDERIKELEEKVRKPRIGQSQMTRDDVLKAKEFEALSDNEKIKRFQKEIREKLKSIPLETETIQATKKRNKNIDSVVLRAIKGDEEAFSALYKEHHKNIYGVCLRIVKNPETAKDLTQEIFMKLPKRIKSFRGDSAFSTWLYRVAVNEAKMYLRKISDKKTGIEREIVAGQEVVDSLIENATNNGSYRKEENEIVSRIARETAIEKLPPGQKTVYLLSEEGYNQEETAQKLDIDIGSVKSQLSKARFKLRKFLD